MEVGIWRISEEKVCESATLYNQRGDIYIHDCTLDADLYCQHMGGTKDKDVVFKEIKIKIPWFRGHPDIIQDGAPPHTGHDNVEFFNQKGRPTQSPDLNVNSLAFFAV